MLNYAVAAVSPNRLGKESRRSKEIQGSMSAENSVRPSRKNENTGSAKNKPLHCSIERCGMPSICLLLGRLYCLPHFIAQCYERLEHCKRSQFPSSDGANFEREDHFLEECSERAAELVCPLRGFDNLERARLFDIFLWASELRANRAVLRPDVSSNSRAAHGASGT